MRFSDRPRQRLIAVREDHRQSDRQAINTLVSLPVDGDASGGQVMVEGNDFYSSPSISPNGRQLAWLTWNHPNMPWDGTELWVAELTAGGALTHAQLVAGGKTESIFQPRWSPDNVLTFVSDRTDWWNLYCWRNDQVKPVAEMEAEFGMAQWVFGMSTYDFESAARIICTYRQDGIDHLARVDTVAHTLTVFDIPYNTIGSVHVGHGQAVFVGGSPTHPHAVIRLDLATGQSKVLRTSSEVPAGIAPDYLSIPESIEFPTEHGLTAYGFFYPPHNRDFAAPANEKPPLLVKTHGGPTGATMADFDLEIQYWTSRGFAVLDVNYGGSTGYGRKFRQRLNGQWGVVDVDDVVNGARFLVQRGDVDGNRLAIDGGSAGGYTALAVLAFRDVFHVGASYFGLSDLETFIADTHKFESRYLDSIVGPYPEQMTLYRQRSPIHHVEGINCPVILFQGLEDKVVPPDQAVRIYEAVRAKGLPVAYVPYAGEQHGFRHAENIKHSLDNEFYFIGQVFGYQPADVIDAVTIDNSSALHSPGL